MWHSAKIRPQSPSGSAGWCDGTIDRMYAIRAVSKNAQEFDVVQMAHRVEVAEAHAVEVGERPALAGGAVACDADVAHPQRIPVSCAWTGSGLAGSPSGGCGSL